MAKSGISGKKIVPLLYGTAVLLCIGLLWYGLSNKDSPPEDLPLPEREQAGLQALEALPGEWMRISFVEGQGWVLFEPCGSEVGSLRIEPFPSPPRLVCTHCDTLQEATVRRARLRGSPERLELATSPDGHEILVESVDALVAMRFNGAPVRDYVMTWKLDPESAMYFVPSAHAEMFEILRAEDESPEGCLGNGGL